MRKAVSRIIPSRQSRRSSGQPAASSATNNCVTLSNANFKIDLNAIEEFYLTLDEPHKLWLPRDELSGQIILISRKNLANITISLALVGCVKINALPHSKLRPVKHTLFNHTILIYGGETNDDDDYGDPEHGRNNNEFRNGLFKGEHRFPFIVKLPNKRIFTSIDFGKGSITYMLRATISNDGLNPPSTSSVPSPSDNDLTATQSSSGSNGLNFILKAKNFKLINNTSLTSERLIQLVSPIDVSKLPPAKPKRLIIKLPRPSKKLSRTMSSTSTINTFGTMSLNNSDGGVIEDSSFVNSNVPSVGTPNVCSTPSSNAGCPSVNAAVLSGMPPPATPPKSEGSTSAAPSSISDRESIRVSLEVPSRGYLRGELIPIKLNISHLKLIQDLNGIIVTFVRVCRLENGPASLFESFRKDLYQQVVPLYVDPSNLLAEASTSVRVPADAFPTISGCPLVSFQYFIEVLVNLSGKSIPIDGTDSSKSGANPKELIINAATSTGSFNFDFTPQESFSSKERKSYINTDKYKRMKKFIQLTTEVIVGTHRLVKLLEMDHILPSAQSNGALRRSLEELESQRSAKSSTVGSNYSPLVDGNPPIHDSVNQNMSQDGNLPGNTRISLENSSQNMSSPPPPPATIPPYSLGDRVENNGQVPGYQESSNTAATVPVPNITHLSEKDQMQLREASLLPSAPPLDHIEEDIDGVSPVDHSVDILDQIPEPDQEYHDTISDPIPAQNETEGGYSFFTYADEEEISLQKEPSELDYVPNYNTIVNDALVDPTNAPEQDQNSNTSMTTFKIQS